MPVYNFTSKTLGHAHPVISTAAEMVEYSTPKKGVAFLRGYLLTLSSINPEISIETHKYFILEIIEKPGHGHMR